MEESLHLACRGASVHGGSALGVFDLRVRLAAACAFSAVVALSVRPAACAAAFGAAAALTVCARVPWRGLVHRLTGLNVFMLLLFLTLPWTVPGAVCVRVGPAALTREGLCEAGLIALKGNAIVLCFSALLAGAQPEHLGHALSRLGAPRKLAHLFLLTVRYVHVLGRERAHMWDAMRVRCFRPRFSAHACRSIGYLVGMILVRSLDRSERVLHAMKCRGFQGAFHVLDESRAGWRDAVFGLCAAVLLAALAWAELQWPIR